MSTIKCICIDQALAFENTPVIASGSLENHVSFTFCGKWTGYTKTAVFWRNEADAYHVILDSTGTCQLPPEVSDDQGTVYFGVFGVNGAKKQRTSNVLTYRIEKGAISVATAPSDPTPDIYTQLLAMERAFETHIEQLVVNGLVPDNSMTTPKLQDGIITTPKLADGSVTNAKLAAKSVTAEKMAANSIGADQLLGGAVTVPKMGADMQEYLELITKTANIMPQVAVGSYGGTGTYGEENPCTLTFDFVPMMLVIVRNSKNISDAGTLMIRGQTKSSGFGHYTSDAFYLKMEIEWLPNGVRWYSDDMTDQFNSTNGTYHYFAIGTKIEEVQSDG